MVSKLRLSHQQLPWRKHLFEAPKITRVYNWSY